MTFVVTENCIKCKYMDCVEVCPVDCFHVGPNMLVIDPDECIDCTLCEPECPAEAIFSEEELPDGQQAFKALNAELAKKWPVITEKKDRPGGRKGMGRLPQQAADARTLRPRPVSGARPPLSGTPGRPVRAARASDTRRCSRPTA